MRERISRGKRIDNGEWVYWDRYGRITDINGEPTKNEIDIPTLLPYPTYIADLPVIREDTVGDYTGLTDKNGTKIFEGDLFVPYTYGEKDNDFAGAIEKCGASFVLRSKNYADSQLDDYVEKIFSHYQPNVGEIFVPKNEVAQGEVIGTIYDNPELLEDEQ